MVPEVIYSAITRLYFEIKVIWFPPRSEDGSNLDLLLVHEK
jgi:hypothetical protein